MILSTVFLLGLISSISAETVFSDNFNSGINSAWTNNGVVAYLGHATFGDGDYLRLQIDTSMYNNPEISWRWRTTDQMLGELGDVVDDFRAEYSTDGTNWFQMDNLHVDDEWSTVAPFDLPSSSTLYIRFRYDSDVFYEGDKVNLDNVIITGTPKDVTAPVCSVDYLKQKYTNNEYVFADSIYIGEDGYFYVHGNAVDTESKIINVQYNRTSPNLFHEWSGSDSVDGAFNELNEDWKSDKDDSSYIEGIHNICCKVTDESNNVAIGDCQEFCIDTQDPNKVLGVNHSNPSKCVAEFVNVAPEFSWDEPESNGCSPIDYYEVEVYYSNGTLDYSTTSDTNSITVENPTNGQDYYIRARAVDMAGNIGEWSDNSIDVYYDNENPVVTITGDDWDVWYNHDFNVIETDTDNLGVLKCEIAVDNDGDGSFDGVYSEVDCNSAHLIDISEICANDRDNICWIRKRATDKACNIDVGEGHKWDLDRQDPITTKTISDPKVAGTEWMQWIIDWFITDETTITLTCDDNGLSGCDETYYRLKYEAQNWSEWMTYDGAFSLLEDGVYTVEYYSTDNAGNDEDFKSEVDKVDTLAPVTTKTIGNPKYQDGYYITSQTLMNLSGLDSEVGCANTYWEILQQRQSNSAECNAYADWTGLADGVYTIEFWSVDKLGNEEEKTTQDHYLDNTKPLIIVWNPTLAEAADVKRCTQAIVVQVSDGTGSGVDESSIYAELYYNDVAVENHKVYLKKSIYGTYEGLMDKQLPAGNYVLKISAKDNVGNEQIVEMQEILVETIFVEYISPASCNVDPELGGSCDFTFNVCMRGGNSVQFWMNKVGGIITPDMMSAMISKNNSTAFVGLKHDDHTSDAGLLQLIEGCSNINGKQSFNLHLDLNSNVTSQIGTGSHDLEYTIESSLPNTCNQPA